MKGNLLIVDDEPMILSNLKILLSSYADEIFLSESGHEALAIIENHPIHCIISDINMPGMNGVEMVRIVRGNQNETPVIFYTGHGNHDLLLEAAKLGAYDFLDKPFLKGLDEVVINGLRKGVKGNRELEDSGSQSEYQKLLKNL